MVTADYFDALYAADSDPWGFRSRWYERRKRALMMAALPSARYRRAFEPGCANGEVTAALAGRCQSVLACDSSARAVALARRRTGAAPNVKVVQLAIPGGWPAQSFDLIVFNEIGYYLRAHELKQTVNHIVRSLAPPGAVVVCHWRHPIEGCVMDGGQVHAMFARCTDLKRQITHGEADFLLEIYTAKSRPAIRE
jgi:SAM-dependent methyltransferase